MFLIPPSAAHSHLVLSLQNWYYDVFILQTNKSCLTSQKIPEYPMGQLQVTVLPSFSTHCPPCRQGELSQGLGPFWQYFPEKPGGHKHLDPDTWSYWGRYTVYVIYMYVKQYNGTKERKGTPAIDLPQAIKDFPPEGGLKCLGR